MHKKFFFAFFSFLTCIPVLWIVLSNLLSSDKGLDLTDESLYLLSADPPTPYSAWGFPHGWHTGILFKAVGYNIADFRTLGAFLLVIAGCMLGMQVGRFINSVNEKNGCFAIMILITTGIGGVGALFYYSGFLRTPGYNWLNLFGIYIAAIGYFEFYLKLNKKIKINSSEIVTISSCIGFGLFISSVAKPSSVIFVYFVGMLPLLSFAWRKWISTIVLIPVNFCFYILIAILTKVWPIDFLNYFVMPMQGPKLMTEHTILGAVLEVFRIPILYYEYISSQNKLIYLLGLAIIFLFFSFVYDKLKIILQFISLMIIAVCCLIISDVFNSTSVNRWNYSPLVSSHITLFLFCFVLFFLSIFRKSKLSKFKHTHSLLVACFLGFIPFIFGFGSGHGCYNQAFLAASPLALGSVVFFSAIHTGPARASLAFIVVLISVVLCFKTIYDSKIIPYRIEPIANNTVKIPVGRHGSILKLDKSLASKLTLLKDEAFQNGWSQGMPLIGLLGDWSSGVAYFLGASVPKTLETSLFGYKNSIKLAIYNLEMQSDSFPMEKAWLLTGFLSSKENMNITQDDVSMILSEVSKTKNIFPDNYTLCAQAGQIKLWFPVNKK